MESVLAYAKAVVAAVGGVATVVSAALADNAISLDEVEGIRTAVIAALTVIGVWGVTNKPAADA